jgi:hypothetical protein
MTQIFKIKLWMSSGIALLACTYVCLYNDIEVNDIRFHNYSRIAAIQLLLKVQWYAFVMPLAGAVMALSVDKVKSTAVTTLFLDLLNAAAIAWVLLCLFLWRLQHSPSVDLRGVM